jgi:hypothetical protein
MFFEKFLKKMDHKITLKNQGSNEINHFNSNFVIFSTNQNMSKFTSSVVDVFDSTSSKEPHKIKDGGK